MALFRVNTLTKNRYSRDFSDESFHPSLLLICQEQMNDSDTTHPTPVFSAAQSAQATSVPTTSIKRSYEEATSTMVRFQQFLFQFFSKTTLGHYRLAYALLRTAPIRWVDLVLRVPVSNLGGIRFELQGSPLRLAAWSHTCSALLRTSCIFLSESKTKSSTDQHHGLQMNSFVSTATSIYKLVNVESSSFALGCLPSFTTQHQRYQPTCC